MLRRKICVVTGTRAEYGLLMWLMKDIQDDPDLELQIIATAMHLSPEFGLTYKVIVQDGFHVSEQVDMQLVGDTAVSVTRSLGHGVIGFADALDRLKPDILVVLGDRFEVLAAAEAALLARIPLAHIHGGELTEGAIDDAIRHAVTKMAHLHFVAAEPYRCRVIQLGESPDRVFTEGAPGLDAIHRLPLLDRGMIEKELGFTLGTPLFLVTYHPATLGATDPATGMKELLAALDQFPDASIVFTKPNADPGNRAISQLIDHYVAERSNRTMSATSLGQLKYLSTMKYADAVIGNSSSGIIEAPALKRPTVNIGVRQQGRLRAASVIDCGETEGEIAASIRQALSPKFIRSISRQSLPYGAGDASVRIKAILKEVPLSGLLIKKFHDIEPCG